MGKLVHGVSTVGAVSFLLLTLASRRSQRARFYLNSILCVISMALSSSIGVVCGLVLSLFPGKRFNVNYIVARSFHFFMKPLIGMYVEVEGEEYLKRRPAIMVGNHQSSIDTLYLGRMFPVNSIIMAKKELKWVPFLGQFMMLSGSAFIDRKSRASAIKTMNATGEHMRKNNLMLFVFPEGTRSNLSTPDMLPFKKGAFHLAVQTQLPIIPMVCENYHRLFDSKTRFEPGKIRLKILPPVETTGMTEKDVDMLCNTVREKMLSQLLSYANDVKQQKIEASSDSSGTSSSINTRALPGLSARF